MKTDHSIKKRTVAAAIWSVIGQGLNSALALGFFVVLGRMLDPSMFGLVAMVMVIGQFAKMFADAGLGGALIQRKRVTQLHYHTIFWLNLAVGFGGALVVLLSAPLVAAFYQDPRVTPITMAVSTTLVFASLRPVPRAILSRSLALRQIATAEVCATLVAGITAVVMARFQFGHWSLVAQVLLVAGLTTAFYWIASRYRPRLAWSFRCFRQLFAFSANLFISDLLGFVVRNIDTVMIGRVLGVHVVGLYSRAYMIVQMPNKNLTGGLSRVLFPSFSSMQHRPEKIKSAFLRVVRMVSLLTFPTFVGLLVLAEPFVMTLLGSRWLGMVPYLQILCVVAMFQSVSALIGNIYKGTGRADILLRVTLLLRLNMIFMMMVGLFSYGAIGLAIGLLVAVLVNQIPNVGSAGRLVGMSFTEYAMQLVRPLACAAAAGGVCWLLFEMLTGKAAAPIVLLAGIAVHVTVYAALSIAANFKAIAEFKRLYSVTIAGQS